MSAWAVAAGTPDPELPTLTIGQLGILRAVEVDLDHPERVRATITPTYSGCPALREITGELRGRLERAGFSDVRIAARLRPAWTSDWITAEGRRALAAAGIAPPGPARDRRGPIPITLGPPPAPACPHCGSFRTRRQAAFAATACRALYRCEACREPFEAVKAL